MKSEKRTKGFGTAMKLAFKENWLFIVIFAVISLIAELFTLYQSSVAAIQFDDRMKETGKILGSLYKYFSTESVNWTPANDLLTRFSYLNQSITYVLIFVLFFVVMKNFSFLYSKRKADFFLALPINRTATILAKIISIFSIVVAVFGVQVIVGACGTIMIKNLGLFVKFASIFNSILTNFSFLVLILAIFIFCAVVSGRKFHYVCLTISISLFPFVLKMWSLICNYYIRNYVTLKTRTGNFEIWWLGLLVAIVFVGLSVIAFKRRKGESAESRIAFRFPVTMAMIVVQLSGFLFVPTVLSIIDKRISYFVLLPICVVTTALVTVIGELILTKLKNKKAAIIQYFVVTLSLVCLSLCFIGINASVTHTEKVLDAKEVDEVLYYDQYFNKPVQAYLVGQGQFLIAETISAQANIQKILDIINEPDDYKDRTDLPNIRICLKLKNGKTFITKSKNLKLNEISDNQYALDNKKFFETDLNDVNVMFVTSDMSINKSGFAIVRDKNEMKSIRDSVDKNSKKITLDTDKYGIWGKIALIKLNDNVPKEAQEEFAKLTDEQLKWIVTNTVGPFKVYGEMVTGVVTDNYCNLIIKERGDKSTMILQEDFVNLWVRGIR